MALRLEKSVVRGEIDNRERGRISGSIWLIGQGQPVRLELKGNCLRDLAGCLIQFHNPKARETNEEKPELVASAQNGVIGDVTASRKVRVFDVPLEEAMKIARENGSPPEHMANSLYIEWFSDANGRVVIESAEFVMKVSPVAWTMSVEEEREQIAATQQAMRDWLDRLDEALQSEQEETFDPEADKPLDEFGYEKMMRESDARTDKYMELLDKYEGHPDQERIVAREMGWEWLEEALEADARGALPPREEIEVPELVPNPLTEGIDWVRDEDGRIHHPLTKRAMKSAMSMWHFCKDRGLLGDTGDEDLRDMIFQFQTTGAKIAGALDSLAYDEDGSREGGFVVAALKRALNYLNASMAAAKKVAQKKLIDSERLDLFRKELFGVREEILELMERFRAKSK
jgi:hypothetical protein